MNTDGPRVLVVDDEPNITELVAMALRYEGFNVKTAATGRGAITAVSQFSPALMILDVMLPDIAGSTAPATRSRSSSSPPRTRPKTRSMA
jgi:two-component system OmpR family response regulator